MTLIELLTSMAVLALVLTAVLAMFTTGLGAETDMNTRFQSQQNARIALSDMRDDIGGACSSSVPAGNASVTLTEPSSFGSCSASTSSVTWCADSASGSAPFTLYRQAAATCGSSTGVAKVGSLTTNALFTPTCTAGLRRQLAVTLPVNANLNNAHSLYTLGDTIMMRNSSVAVSC